jgi:histone H3/H4
MVREAQKLLIINKYCINFDYYFIAKRVTIQPKDIQLARRLRGERS